MKQSFNKLTAVVLWFVRVCVFSAARSVCFLCFICFICFSVCFHSLLEGPGVVQLQGAPLFLGGSNCFQILLRRFSFVLRWFTNFSHRSWLLGPRWRPKFVANDRCLIHLARLTSFNYSPKQSESNGGNSDDALRMRTFQSFIIF
jgi:hypothetical protein